MGRLFYAEQCASTMDEAAKYFSTERRMPFMVYTLDQTGGRGNYGKVWDCAPGQNLALTYVLDAPKNFSANLINYYTALCTRDFLAEITGLQPEIKWPNDIIIKNKKISGILLETKKFNDNDYLLIGIGMNVLQENFGNLTKAGSLKTVSGKNYEPRLLAEKFFSSLMTGFQNIPEPKTILACFNKFLFKKGEVAVFLVGNSRQNGIIIRAEEDGYLLINLEKDGEKKFYYKEIEMLY